MAVVVGPSAAGSWIEDWLSPPRFAAYLADAGTDRSLALDRYEWNTTMSAAIMHDLAHLEVGVRNAYDRAFRSNTPAGSPPWVFDSRQWFPPRLRKAAGGIHYDDNEKSRKLIAAAVRDATPLPTSSVPHPPAPAPGKVIAELSFGFWRYLSRSVLEKPLWLPHLSSAFTPGTDRRAVDEPMRKLNELRNRVAHHEPLFAPVLAQRHTQILTVAELISPDLRDHIRWTSTMPATLATRP